MNGEVVYIDITVNINDAVGIVATQCCPLNLTTRGCIYYKFYTTITPLSKQH